MRGCNSIWIGGLFIALLCFSLYPERALAESVPTVQVTDVQIEYEFDTQLTIGATFTSESPITEAVLFLQQGEQPEIAIGPIKTISGSKAHFTYNLSQNPLRPFSLVFYWFAVTLENGQHQLTPKYQFFYLDNRFEWQTLEDDAFQVHWYQGDVIFAQEVLGVAQSGWHRVQEFLPLELPDEVNIYIYDSVQALQAALRLTTERWVAGHADPEMGVILVSLPVGPEQRLEMERQIPHELMHLMLYQKTGKAYANLPLWFTEGLASAAELYPNPDYQVLLEDAYRNNTLLPLSSLCRSFPNDTAGALLAYAEAASFVRFIYNHHQTSGLEKLVHEYMRGADCEQGVSRTLDASLDQLEARWKIEAFSGATHDRLLTTILPWVALLFVVLAAPLILSLALLRHKDAKLMGG